MKAQCSKIGCTNLITLVDGYEETQICSDCAAGKPIEIVLDSEVAARDMLREVMKATTTGSWRIIVVRDGDKFTLTVEER